MPDPKFSFGKFGKVGVTGENASYFFVQSPFVLIPYLAEGYKRYAFAKAFSRSIFHFRFFRRKEADLPPTGGSALEDPMADYLLKSII